MPARGARPAPGWYVAKHRDSTPETKWSVIGVAHWQQSGRTAIAVFQVGSENPENPENWRLRYRILGVESIPDRPRAHPKVETISPEPRAQGLHFLRDLMAFLAPVAG